MFHLCYKYSVVVGLYYIKSHLNEGAVLQNVHQQSRVRLPALPYNVQYNNRLFQTLYFISLKAF